MPVEFENIFGACNVMLRWCLSELFFLYGGVGMVFVRFPATDRRRIGGCRSKNGVFCGGGIYGVRV